MNGFLLHIFWICWLVFGSEARHIGSFSKLPRETLMTTANDNAVPPAPTAVPIVALELPKHAVMTSYTLGNDAKMSDFCMSSCTPYFAYFTVTEVRTEVLAASKMMVAAPTTVTATATATTTVSVVPKDTSRSNMCFFRHYTITFVPLFMSFQIMGKNFDGGQKLLGDDGRGLLDNIRGCNSGVNGWGFDRFHDGPFDWSAHGWMFGTDYLDHCVRDALTKVGGVHGEGCG